MSLAMSTSSAITPLNNKKFKKKETRILLQNSVNQQMEESGNEENRGKIKCVVGKRGDFLRGIQPKCQITFTERFIFFANENCIDYSIKSMKISKFLFIKNKNVSIKWCNLKY